MEMQKARVIGLRINGLVVEVYPGVEPLRLPADALITFVDPVSAAPTTADSSLAALPGFDFLNPLSKLNDAPLFGSVVVEHPLGDTEQGPRQVMYVKGISPADRALEAALFKADDERFDTVTLPIAPITGLTDEQKLLNTCVTLGRVLAAHHMTSIRRVKLVQPHASVEVSAALVQAIAIGAKSAAERKQPGTGSRPQFDFSVQAGDITGVPDADAVIACISSDGTKKFAINDVLNRLAGDTFHRQLDGKGIVEGRTFYTTSGGTAGLPFRGVLFVVNNFGRTPAEFIEEALRAADNLGLKRVVLPVLSFVADENPDDYACGDLFNAAQEAAKNFIMGGWKSLQLAAMVMPPNEKKD